jgi:hypothetical protein
MATHPAYNLHAFGNQDVHIGTIPLQNLRDIHKDKVEPADLCAEASFMKGDKDKVYKVITETVGDIIHIKRGRGRPLGSKNKK